MALKIKTSTEGAGSGVNWLKEPGRYHALMLDGNEQPMTKDSKPIDAFQVQFCVLSPDDQKGKQCDIMFFYPDMSKSDKAIAFAERKQTACLIALGLITEAQMGTDVVVNLVDAKVQSRQFFVEMEKQEGKDGNKDRLSLAYANIYHVDDPACADPAIWPRDAAMIAKIPAAHRRDPASFPKHERKGSAAGGASAGAGGTAQGNQQPAKNVDFEGF